MWTNIPKPTGLTYTNVNPMGKEQYDQVDITYDDSNVFYDGINPNQWTDVAKPIGGYDVPWSDMGMVWSEASQSWESSNPWIKVSKPI